MMDWQQRLVECALFLHSRNNHADGGSANGSEESPAADRNRPYHTTSENGGEHDAERNTDSGNGLARSINRFSTSLLLGVSDLLKIENPIDLASYVSLCL
jgi:hypothetical protein